MPQAISRLASQQRAHVLVKAGPEVPAACAMHYAEPAAEACAEPPTESHAENVVSAEGSGAAAHGQERAGAQVRD